MMIYSTYYIYLAAIFGFAMAWGMGANDVANAMGTSVGSKSLTLRQAVIIAAVFEFLGALLAGGNVTATISHGIIDVQQFVLQPQLLIFGMLSALLAAAIWLFLASRYGWPVSTTHSIVGAIAGFTWVGVGKEAIHWASIAKITLAWVVSPLIGGVIAYVVFISIHLTILNKKDPFAKAKFWLPWHIFVVGFMVACVTIMQGLSHLGIVVGWLSAVLISVCFAFVVMLVGMRCLSHVHRKRQANNFTNVEPIFGVLMMFTACTMAFAHGSNDVANAVGPMAAVVNAVQWHTVLTADHGVPMGVLLVGAVGLVVGLVTYGYRVMATVGSGITQLTPSRGYAATIAAALTVVGASATGIPISTTHTLVGGVMGVGLARGIGALNLGVLRNIIISWVITLPAGAVLAMAVFKGLQGVLSP